MLTWLFDHMTHTVTLEGISCNTNNSSSPKSQDSSDKRHLKRGEKTQKFHLRENISFIVLCGQVFSWPFCLKIVNRDKGLE